MTTTVTAVASAILAGALFGMPTGASAQAGSFANHGFGNHNFGAAAVAGGGHPEDALEDA
jgi:hypothetical protein